MNIKLAASLCLAASVASIASAPACAQLSSNATIFASGLESPRGLKFGPDGDLYVAEAGTGGTISTVGSCAQVPPPIGSYLGGHTGRISKLDKSGNRTTVASGFPSSLAAEGDLQGVADIAFLNDTLYAVTAGGGCSHGNASSPNIIARVDTKSGSWKPIVNLSTFLKSHPAAYPDLADFEPDGVFYSLIAHDNRLYTVEPNHGQLFSISASGEIREELDISRQQGHIVPTSVAVSNGKFYIGNLGLFPITPNSGKVMSFTAVPAPGPTSSDSVAAKTARSSVSLDRELASPRSLPSPSVRMTFSTRSNCRTPQAIRPHRLSGRWYASTASAILKM